MKSIRSKLLLGFSVVLLLVVFMAVSTIYNTNKTNNLAEELVTDDLEELIIYQTLRFNVAERIAVTRGFLLYGDESLKEKFFAYTDESKELEEQLQGYLSDSEKPMAEEIISRSVAWGDYITTEVYDVYETNPKAAIENNNLAKKETEELMSLIGEAVELEDNTVHDMGNDILENGMSTERTNILIALLVIVIGISVALVVSSMIVKPILQVVQRLQAVAAGDFTGEEMVSSSKDEVGILIHTLNRMTTELREIINQVRSTSEQVAAASEELTASAEQTSTATEQISNAIQEVSEGSTTQLHSVKKSHEIVSEISKGMTGVAGSIQSVAGLTTETTEKTVEGNAIVKQTVEQMNDVQQQVVDTSAVINGLEQKSMEIGQIVELISQIASQTNLLALNAAIEAARAGQHGKGFAVVADEVGKLAEESGRAAGQINALIKDIQQETVKAVKSMEQGTLSVSEGIQLVNQTGKAFHEITSRIEVIAQQSQEAAGIVKEVSAGTGSMEEMIRDVAALSNQSNENAQNVAAAAEEQLASMEEVSSSSVSLSNMAENLQVLVRKFKV